MEKEIEIKKGDDLVNFVKNISSEVSKLRIDSDVDYMGCSRSYVYEKVFLAIHDLEWIIDRVAELNREIVRCKECRDFAISFDKNNLCYRCSNDDDRKEKMSEV